MVARKYIPAKQKKVTVPKVYPVPVVIGGLKYYEKVHPTEPNQKYILASKYHLEYGIPKPVRKKVKKDES